MLEQEIYDNLFEQSISSLEAGQNACDHLLADRINDTRFGITLRLRPNKDVLKRISDFQKELIQIDKSQYYPPIEDLHLTVMAIIACEEGFNINKIPLEEFKMNIIKSIDGIKSLNVAFNGITCSPDALLVQGYSLDSNLDKLRNNIRDNFKNSSLSHSIDSRYPIRTAHITIARFTKKINRPKDFANMIKENRIKDFGVIEFKEIELTLNDWYHTNKTINLLDCFTL